MKAYASYEDEMIYIYTPPTPRHPIKARPFARMQFPICILAQASPV